MIETHLRKTYQKICVDPLLQMRSFQKISPIFLTVFGGIIGVCVLPALALGLPLLALGLIVFSGYLDTLDGSLARHQQKSTARGAALDIVSDRAVEFAIILGLYCVNPVSRGLPAILMLGSVLICVTSFLIVGVFTENSSEKSFHYSPGLVERAEAFLFFSAMILFPALFASLAYLFSFLVFLTATIRMAQFIQTK
jgi:archaetidylinositol phosphate synthase